MRDSTLLSDAQHRTAKPAFDATLAAATELFRERGFQATSMAEIAKRAGVSVGSLYAHFPGKADLFLEVFRAYGRRQSGLVRDAIASARSAGVTDDIDLFVAGTHAYLLGAHREAALGRQFQSMGSAEIDVQSVHKGQEVWVERNARLLGLDLASARDSAIAASITGALGGWVRGVQHRASPEEALQYIAEVVVIERAMLRAMLDGRPGDSGEPAPHTV